MKKKVLNYLLLAGFFFMLGFFRTYHLPDIKIWAIEKIESYSDKNLPFQVLISDIDFTFYPIGINFNNIRLFPKQTLSESIEPILIDSLKVSLNPFSFLTGLFQFSRIEFVNVKLNIKNTELMKNYFELNKTDSNPISFKNILSVPLNNLTIRNLDLQVPASNINPLIDIQNFSIDFENQKNSILISVFAPHLSSFDPEIADIPAKISAGMRFIIFDDQLLLSALRVTKGKSNLLLSGYLNTKVNDIQFEDYSLKVKTELRLDDLRRELEPFIQKYNIPKISGSTTGLLSILKKPQEQQLTDYRFKFSNLIVDQYSVGEVSGKVFYQSSSLKSDSLVIKNSAGIISAKNLQFQTTEDFKYNVDLNLNNLNLRKFLFELGLGDIPVESTINTNIPCSGALKTKTLLQCQGVMEIQDFKVLSEESIIAEFTNGKLNGQIEVTPEQVLIQSEIELGPNSKGFANGSVHYNKGFQFQYKTTPNLDFSDINVANLELLGLTEIQGATQGDSNSAVFNISLKSKDSEISNFYLGDIAFGMNYKSGKLFFNDIDGQVRTTKYKGDLTVDLANSKISGDFNSSYLELSDLKRVFMKKVDLPIEIYGGGKAQAQFSGPLEFSQLSYVLNSEFYNGNIATESFDSLKYEVESKNGFVTLKDTFIKKNNGILKGSGTANPDGNINTLWEARNFSIKTLNTFSKSNINIDGIFDFDLKLNGYILEPDTKLNGVLKQTTLNQEKVPDSTYNLTISKDNISGAANILGNQIQSQFKIPFSSNSEFKLDAKIQDLDFTPLIHLISSKERASEYEGKLTAEINLNSPSQFLWKANGFINLDKFSLRRGTRSIQTNEKTVFNFSNGNLSINKLNILGDNTSLNISTLQEKQNPIELGLNGKIDLSMLAFLTPFFDDFRGTSALSTRILANQNHFSVFGSSYITNGLIRSAEFPHQFENIESDIVFSGDKITINRLQSNFASGKLEANGEIQVKSVQNFETQLNGKFKDVQLAIPTDMNTKGSGEFSISGNWFPYLLRGSYLIQEGLITKDFTETNESTSQFTRSLLLPKELAKEVSEIIILDFDTTFTKGIDLKNDLIQSKAYGKLKIKGPPSSTIVLGQIQLQRNGKLFFRDTEFEIESGDLKFNDNIRINPELYISANTIVTETKDTTTQRYEINMLIQGKADNPNINLTSNPPRTDRDIISLLALGITTESYQNTTDSSQIQRQSYEVGATLLTKNKFGRDLRERTGFEFKVSSALDQNNNSAVPKVTISRQWTPRIETSASRTFGESTTNDLRVEYQLNRNFSLIGSWEGRETTNNNLTSDSTNKTTTDILGLDIEYKMEFK